MHITCEMLGLMPDVLAAFSSAEIIKSCSIPVWQCVTSRCKALHMRFHVHMFVYLHDTTQCDVQVYVEM